MVTAEPIVRTFDNGLTVVVDEMHSAPVAAVRFYVRAGSVYEQAFMGAGITHYLEHLMDDGSAKRTAEEIDDLQEAMGNQSNAYTSASHTCYHMTSSSRYVDDMIDLVADYLFNPLLAQENIDTQRGIILREMAMGEDDPGRKIHHLLMHTMFRVHPQRYRVIGYPETFNKVTREDLVSYHRRMYTTDNVVAVVVGDFDAGHVLEVLEKSLGGIPETGTNFPALPQEPAQTSERRAEEIAPTLGRAYIAMGYHTVDLFHPDLYPLDVLAYVLANGSSSRLVSKLRDEQGLVDSIGCWSATPVYDAGSFVVSATLDEAKLAEAEQAMIEEVERAKTEPVSAQELARAKKQKAAELVYSRGSVASWASALGSDYLATGDVNFSRRYVEGIRGVTAEDIMAAAGRYLHRHNRTVVVRRAGNVEAAGGETAVAQEAKDTEKSALENGITLLVREDHRAAMASVQASFLGGLRYETEETAGSGRVLAAVLKRGTETRTRTQIAEALENVGAQMGGMSGRNSFNVSGTCLTEDLDLLMSLMADCLRNPSFPQTELDRVKGLSLAAIQAQQDDVDQVASRLMMEELFKAHPYRLNPLGTEASIDSITREKLSAYHSRICQPQQMVLAVYGDVDLKRVAGLAQKHFGDWSPGQAGKVTLAPEAPPEQERRAVKEREQGQGLIYIGFSGISVDSTDRFALDVLDAAFSGIDYPGGRLHAKLRGDQLVYATHMVPVAGIDPGYVFVYAATQPEKLEVVEQTIRDLIADIQTNPLPEAEFERAKKMCISAHEVQLGDVGDRILLEALDELYGLGFEDTLKYGSEIEKVTVADVQAAANKYLDLDHCAIAITRPLAESGGEG